MTAAASDTDFRTIAWLNDAVATHDKSSPGFEALVLQHAEAEQNSKHDKAAIFLYQWLSRNAASAKARKQYATRYDALTKDVTQSVKPSKGALPLLCESRGSVRMGARGSLGRVGYEFAVESHCSFWLSDARLP
jgi:hypothetical protein